MFGFFKEALKKTLGKFTKAVEKEATVEKVSEEETPPEKKHVAIKQPEEKTAPKHEEKHTDIRKHPEKKPAPSAQELINAVQGEPLKAECLPHEIKQPSAQELLDTVEEKQEDTSPDYIEIEAPKDENVEEEREKKGFFARIFGRKTEEDLNEQIAHDLDQEVEEKVLEGEAAAKLEEEHNAITLPSDEIAPAAEAVEEELDAFEEEAKLDREEKKLQEEQRKQREEKIALLKREHEQKKEKVHEEEEKKGFFGKIADAFTKITLKEEKFEELFWDLEIIMLENNVAVEVIEKIKMDLKAELTQGKISRHSVEKIISETLKESITQLFDVEQRDIIAEIKMKKKQQLPYVIVMIGVNGSGKTTSMAKLAHMIQKEGHSCVMAASDTFRAAAIHQLEEHANRLNVKLIKHDYHADPAAVAFDAVAHAKAKNIDVVLIDTAGRMHSNANLIEELKKVVRVNTPDLKIFVGESITGNDCVEQAKEFDKAVGIDAIILTKADVDDKGGAAISVSFVTKKPILYLGNGQKYADLTPFDAKIIVESLGLA
ncbi:MAG: signal recognition particle-docking protein FtsY [archaeon]